MKILLLSLLLFSYPSFAGLSGASDVDIYDSNGNEIDATAGSLNVNVTGGGGGGTVNQGSPGPSPWPVSFLSAQDINVTNASIPVTGTFFQATQPVSGTFWQATQPISASSLPLPSGAATSALQSTINTTLGSPFQAGGSIGNTTFASTQSGAWSVTANAGTNLNTSALNLESTQSSFKSANHTDLGTINTTLGSPFQAGGSIGNSSFGATQSGTWNINNVSGTISLPTGAATSSLQTSGNASLTSLDGKTTVVNTGAIQNADNAVTGTVGSAGPPPDVEISTVGMGTVFLDLSGTWSGTIFYDYTVDGTNWNAARAYRLDSAANNTSTTVNRQQVFCVAGMNKIRIYFGSYVSGTANIAMNASQAPCGLTPAFPLGTESVSAAQSGTWNITNVSGTVSLPTGASTSSLQTTGNTSLSTIATNTGNISTGNASLSNIDSSTNGLLQSQGTAISGIRGTLNQALASSATHAGYSTGTMNPLYMDLNGALRVNGSDVTQPVSGTVSANATLSAETTKVIGTVNISASQTVGLAAGSQVIGHVINDASSAVIGHVIADSGSTTAVTGTVTVSGPLTDTQLRATPPLFKLSDASGTFLATLPVSLASAPSTAVTNAGTFAVQATVAASATNIAKAEDSASSDLDVGVPSLAVRKATPANTSGSDGDYEFLQMSAGRLWASATIDAALPAGANVIGHVIADSGSTTAVTGNVAVTQAANSIAGSNPCMNPTVTLVSITGATSTTNATQIIALSGSTKIYICSLSVIGVSGTLPTFSLVQGTGSNCVTSQTTVVQAFSTLANAITAFAGPIAVGAAGNELCYKDGGTTPVQNYQLTYVQQ